MTVTAMGTFKLPPANITVLICTANRKETVIYAGEKFAKLHF